ncbi:MAG: MFS transporter [Alphaproteobacteria bacterium]|nr:MFS transporter [Alphaproteobacteria bacterium]
MGRYLALFRNRPFFFFWLGFSLSVTGDSMTQVALVWHVYSRTGSPEAVGLLNFLFIAPVVVGGILAGWLLDRFERKSVLVIDSLAKAMIVSLIPLLDALGLSELWHAYGVAATFGLLMMVPLAGVPAIIPSLVENEQLQTANALEIVSYTLSGVIGAPIAGVLIGMIGSANVLLVDGASYLLFALALTQVEMREPRAPPSTRHARSQGFGDALRLCLSNPVLKTTTLMFMAANLGFGALLVWLPVFAAAVPGGGPELYGYLSGAMAAGAALSSALVGIVVLPLALGLLICLTQALSGLSLLPLLLTNSLWIAFLVLFLVGVFRAPMTIWAQTLRMQIIPAEQRGRVFALLRMMMQSGTPLGGLGAGLALPIVGGTVLIGTVVLATATSGLLGVFCRPLRLAGSPQLGAGTALR